MIRYFLTVLLILLAAFIFRQFIPVLPDFFYARVFLVPLIFLCAAVTVQLPAMLIYSFICGFLWDAQHTVLPVTGDIEVYSEPISTLRFGYSIILFAIAGLTMQGVQPIFREGKWQVSVMVTGLALFLYLLLELMLLSFVQGQILLSLPTIRFILASSAITMFASPFVFLLLFKLAKTFRYTITYDGLRRGKGYTLENT